jgi:peptidoglycan/LPS O-acetylase OafA/YrhL
MDPVTLRYGPHIDGLRAVAVICVVCFHAFPQAVPGGFAGVDVFFVISGFLISSILYREFAEKRADGRAVIVDFYARRVRRIFPSLIVVLVCCYCLGYRLLLPGEFATLSRQMVASAGFYQNFLLSRGAGYFASDSRSNPLLHLWSLGVEEQFYLLWPLAIWAAVRCRIRLLPAAVFLAACSFFWNMQRSLGTWDGAFYLPQMRMWELLIGSIAAVVHPLMPRGRDERGGAAEQRGGASPGRPPCRADLWDNAVCLLGCALVAAGLLALRSDMDLPGAWTLLPTLGAALIVTSSGSAWVNRRILSNRLLVWIGLISYPLYLWHWMLLTFASIGSEHPDSPLTKAAALLAAGVLSWLTYRFVEIPVRRGRRAPWTALALAAAMVLVAGAALRTEHEGGFPSRFPALLREISAFKYDPAPAWRQGAYFLMPDQDETKFKVDPAEIVPGRPTLVLWGDSHAAALYPGLRQAYGARYNIVQRTAAGTPPLLEDSMSPGVAQQIDRYVFALIRRLRPECVVLQARWQSYEWGHVAETIVALKAAGVRRVVLVGPVPQWFVSLPQQLFNYARLHRSDPVPVRMKMGIDPEPCRIDAPMAALAERNGAEYVSPCAILGNQEGFLVRTADTADSLTAFDYGHLTESGSRYLVSRFPKL